MANVLYVPAIMVKDSRKCGVHQDLDTVVKIISSVDEA